MTSAPGQSASSTAPERFEALDSLRGVCAMIVAIYHFRVSGVVANLDFVRHGWLFVDFFFVLSGFVIAHAYGARLNDRRASVGRFMALRFGRIYPVHIAMLLVMVAMEALLTLPQLAAMSAREPFTGARSGEMLAANLALLQSFGVSDTLTWNGPSWSIAAEMWTYLLFALVFALAGKRARALFLGLGALAFAVLALLSPRYLHVTYDLGFVRCVFGFALGVAVQGLWARGLRLGGNWTEMAMLTLIVAYVSIVHHGPATLIAPFLFALAVLVFASEGGALSRILRLGPLSLIGTVSYSLYMVHIFVQGRMIDVLKIVGPRLGISEAPAVPQPGEAAASMIMVPGGLGDVLVLVMLALVVVAAYVSYRLIERPFRDLSRHISSQWGVRQSA